LKKIKKLYGSVLINRYTKITADIIPASKGIGKPKKLKLKICWIQMQIQYKPMIING